MCDLVLFDPHRKWLARSGPSAPPTSRVNPSEPTLALNLTNPQRENADEIPSVDSTACSSLTHTEVAGSIRSIRAAYLKGPLKRVKVRVR